MDLKGWLKEFCTLHERASRGALSADERQEYLAARNELARALLRAQRVALQPGQAPRRSLRAALALPVTLNLPTGKLSTLTQDISAGGFSTLLAVALPAGLVLPFSLRLSRRSPPVEGHARLVALVPAGGGFRASLAQQDLGPDEIERLELAVFDAVVAQLTSTEEGTPGAPSAKN